MEIIIASRNDIDKRTLFKMTKGKDNINVKSMEDGEIFSPVDFVVYRETNSKGDEVEILSILAADDRVICAQSDTFKTSFMEVWDTFERECEIKKISGVSKSGREYVDCTLY